MNRIKVYIFALLALLIASSTVLTTPTAVSAKTCGKLGSYTTWYYSTVEKIWKPILYVWKGKGSANPTSVSVWFDNKSVPNADDAVKTTPNPQVDNNDGWVGYFIAKRWYLFTTDTSHFRWDDDFRWEVRGCIP